jgi:hypothetical protein
MLRTAWLNRPAAFVSLSSLSHPIVDTVVDTVSFQMSLNA